MNLLLKWLEPWEFSWSFLLLYVAVGVLYARGCRRQKVNIYRRSAFWIGMATIYLSLHTYLDYYAEHEFFMHRIQQVLLHHLAPLIIVAAAPGNVLRAGLPFTWRVHAWWPCVQSLLWRRLSAVLFNPLLVTLLFVFFVLIWLFPPVQTLAMLDWRIYRLMNWTMLLSGFSYWWLVLDHRPHPPGRMIVGLRVLSPGLTMTPQILAGAIVTFSKSDLYPIFEICGRAFTFDVLSGQQIGGMVMWVPAALIESIGALLALRNWLRLSRLDRARIAMIDSCPPLR